MSDWLASALVSENSILFHDTWHFVRAFITNRRSWLGCLQLHRWRNISWKPELVNAWQNCCTVLTTGPRSRWNEWDIEMNVTDRMGGCDQNLFGSRLAFVNTIIIIGFQRNSWNFLISRGTPSFWTGTRLHTVSLTSVCQGFWKT